MIPDWVTNIIKSEFLWGIITGLILAIIGAIIQIKLARTAHKEIQSNEMKELCGDIISNLMKIINDIKNTRRLNSIIHEDLLILIDVEISIFGKVRERTIHLPKEIRIEVREYITDCALRRGEIGMKLRGFYDKRHFADNLRDNGDIEASEQIYTEAEKLLNIANISVDDLISTVEKGDKIILELKP